jgi:hypothetical protein
VGNITERKLTWKKLGKEDFNATILSTDNNGPKPSECEMFQLFGKNDNVQDVHLKINTGLP